MENQDIWCAHNEDDGLDENGGSIGTTVISRPKTDLQEPSMYQVLLHNDDYTPMEFVVEVLEKVFRKNTTEATKIMMDVHQKGVGICGVYPYEVAETKVAIVADAAREHEYPLKCTMDKTAS